MPNFTSRFKKMPAFKAALSKPLKSYFAFESRGLVGKIKLHLILRNKTNQIVFLNDLEGGAGVAVREFQFESLTIK